MLLALGLAAAACGKKGPPSPPEPRGPFRPDSISVFQTGSRVTIGFDLPQLRGDKPSQQIVLAELVRVTYTPGVSVREDPDSFGRRGVVVNVARADDLGGAGQRQAMIDRRLAEMDDGGVGWTLRYAVRLRDQRGRISPLGTTSDLVLLPPVPGPSGVRAEPTADGIRLLWDASPLPPGLPPPAGRVASPSAGSAETPGPAQEESGEAASDEGPVEEGPPAGQDEASGSPSEAEDAGKVPADDEPVVEGQEDEGEGEGEGEEADPPEVRTRYNIYRAAPGDPFPEQPLNPDPIVETDYLDTAVRIGESYEYVVRVVLAEGLPRREGESSERFRVVARDTFAPAAPTGLVVVQEGPAVRLFWNPNSERDLAGYRVYRRQGSGAWERIGPVLIDQPSFIDRDVAPDQRLSYYVTAIDRAPEPNESEGSAIEELEIVADPAGESP